MTVGEYGPIARSGVTGILFKGIAISFRTKNEALKFTSSISIRQIRLEHLKVDISLINPGRSECETTMGIVPTDYTKEPSSLRKFR